MNPVIQNIKTRRSIRKYKDTPVPRELIREVMECGKYAPSARNFKQWQFVAVTDKAMIEKIRLCSNISVLMAGWEDSFHKAPCIIIVFAKEGVGEPIKDGNLALQNMMLAAHSLGLGTCYINVVKQLFSFSFGSEIKQQLGVPEDYIATGSITLGYPDEDPEFVPKNMDCDSIY